MNQTDKMMAWAQIVLSGIFIFCTFLIIGIYETGHAHISADQTKSFDSTMNWLTGACLIIIYFWFSRARQGGIPDGSQMVTQSHTAPDGSKTTITAPVGAPAAAVPVLKTSSQSTNQADQTITSTGAAVPLVPNPSKESQ